MLASAASVSAVLLIGVAVLWACSFGIDPYRRRVSISQGVHVTAHAGRVSVFNRADYGPYQGSVVSLSCGGRSDPMLESARGFDLPGVYFRFFRFVDGTLWTFTCSLLIPLAMFAILPGLWGAHHVNHLARA